MKLSEQLRQDHECGDFGKALEGYAERAEELEQQNLELAAAIEQMQSQLLFCAEYLEDCANSPYNAAQCRRVAQLQPSPDLLAKRDQRRDAEVAELRRHC